MTFFDASYRLRLTNLIDIFYLAGVYIRSNTCRCFFIVMAAICCAVVGCSRVIKHNARQYQTVTEGGLRNTNIARLKNNQAIDQLCGGNFTAAEKLLQDALIADVDFGPAHNTLGRLYFQQKKYYLAAWEFEYAMQLMPERVEPVNNLGLVFEAVGRYEDAINYYMQAVNASPETPQYLGNLIRARIANGEKPFYLKREINDLLLIDDRQEWVDWAKLQLLSDDTEARLLRELREQELSQDSQSNELAPELPPIYSPSSPGVQEIPNPSLPDFEELFAPEYF